MTDEEEEMDRELSALLDDELTPARARSLREAIEADPRLRERLAAFESLNRDLQALSGPALPADLRDRLQQRIDQHRSIEPMDSSNAHQGQVPLRPRVSFSRWGAPAAAAIAAGLIAAWLMRPQPDIDPPETLAEVQPELHEPHVAQALTQTRMKPHTLSPEVPRGAKIAIEELADEGLVDPELAGEQELADEDLAMALDFETLRDLDLIHEIDLLEVLVNLEVKANEGRG